MKRIALIVAVLMAFPYLPSTALAANLSMPDALHGSSVASVNAEPTELASWEAQLVKQPQFNEQLAIERDKTNDTVAIALWISILVALIASSSNSGGGGSDGEPEPRSDPSPPGCRR